MTHVGNKPSLKGHRRGHGLDRAMGEQCTEHGRENHADRAPDAQRTQDPLPFLMLFEEVDRHLHDRLAATHREDVVAAGAKLFGASVGDASSGHRVHHGVIREPVRHQARSPHDAVGQDRCVDGSSSLCPVVALTVVWPSDRRGGRCGVERLRGLAVLAADHSAVDERPHGCEADDQSAAVWTPMRHAVRRRSDPRAGLTGTSLS